MSLPVFFTSRMVADFFTSRMVADSESFSPSASKPAQVVAAWQAAGLPIELIEPVPVTIDQLSRAHDRAHVEDILACREPNGFGNVSFPKTAPGHSLRADPRFPAKEPEINARTDEGESA